MESSDTAVSCTSPALLESTARNRHAPAAIPTGRRLRASERLLAAVRRQRLLWKSCLGAQLALCATSASAQEEARRFFDAIQANAFVSFGYTYNTNTPEEGLNTFRVFDEADNTFNVDVAELVLQMPVAEPGEAGFRADLTVGDAIPRKTKAVGIDVGDADLQQAYASYIAPVGSGLRLDFGKFVTHMGLELIEGYDGYNDNYSRSFLFNYAIPFTHTGLKAGYAFSDRVSAALMVVNGWDNVRDNNTSKSVGAQLAVSPVPAVSLYLNYIGGPEQEDVNGALRHVFDVVAVAKATDKLSFALNADYGTEENASALIPGDDASWFGVAGYAKMDATTRFSLAARAEVFEDDDGVRLGQSESTTISGFTLTPTYQFTDNFLIRAEGRLDTAEREVFVKNSGELDDTQTTVAANVIFVF